jgi:hypothetical protein
MSRAALVAALAVFAAATAEGQIRVRNGGIPSPNSPQLTETLSVTRTENLDDARAITHLAWSHDGKTGFEVEVPLVRREASLDGANDENEGIGDVVLLVQRSLSQTDGVLRSNRWALFGDIRLPTGDDKALRGPDGPFPKLMQPGMGSVGLGAGGVWTLIRDRHRVSVSLRGQWNDESDGFRLGPEVQAGVSYWFRLRPAVFDAQHHVTEIRPVFEALIKHRFESQNGGAGTGDEGSLAWLAPGVQAYVRENLLIQASVALPVINAIDDVLGRRDWTALIALRWYF